MRVSRILQVLTFSFLVLFWMSCSTGNGGFGTIGPGTTATYVVFSDGTQINVQSINPNGTLTPILGSPYTAGAQPGAVAVSPSGKWIYVLNGAGSITQYSIASDGTLTSIANNAQTGTQPVAIAIDSQQRYLAVANQGSGNVSIYSINSTNGSLSQLSNSPVTTGNNPVSIAITNNLIYAVGPTSIAEIAIDPINYTTTVVSGSPFAAGAVGPLSASAAGIQLYALDATSDCGQGVTPLKNCIREYTFNITNGAPVLNTFTAAGTGPAAVLPVLNNKFLYVANKTSGNVSAYSINQSTGALTEIAGSPFADGSGTAPSSLAFDSVNNLLLVGNSSASSISVYAVDTGTGALTLTGTRSMGRSVVSVAVAKP